MGQCDFGDKVCLQEETAENRRLCFRKTIRVVKPGDLYTVVHVQDGTVLPLHSNCKLMA